MGNAFQASFPPIAPLLAAGFLLFLDVQASGAQDVFRNARNLPYRGGDLGIEFQSYDPASSTGGSDHLVFEVTDILWGSPLLERLNTGDVIVALDGYYFRSDSDFSAYIASKRPGDLIRVQFGAAESDDISEISVRIPKFSDLLLGEFMRGAARGTAPTPGARNCGLAACADPDALEASKRLQQQLDQQEYRDRFK
jgi:hypothetical protein